MFRILHVSDIHCSLDNLEEVVEAERGNFDVLAITGDICCNSRLRRILSTTGSKVLAVTGNMDDIHIARLLRDYGWLLDGRVEVIGKYVIAGVGGLQPVQDVARLEELLPKALTRESILIVLAHHPIHGYLDVTFAGVHAGLYETKKLVDHFKPHVYLHGHIHEARGVAHYANTLLVNPGPLAHGYYAMIEMDDSGNAHAELRSL
ncbi:metallophosphoesterase [Pyrolobus fumarii 1A]|uniref:Metallophosphoesterase n=1 Tax=Pyrolobus fumarii (strain DSM 11204 / 1A) TaxID=694429 RepID=G0EH93_PYRF1|nr:metallophosphoesterase family protein [Pyrolobus fumarii]AEM39317.1 metallophosphoesterase [Pyrolobus fumarii 1A]